MNSLDSQRLLAVGVAGAVLVSLAGCPTTGPLQRTGESAPPTAAAVPAVELTPAEQEMRKASGRYKDTITGGALLGAAIGAGIGALAGVLTEDDKKKRGEAALAGAAVGATVGGIAGGVRGYVVAKKEQAGGDENRALQAAAADVNQDNNNLQAYIKLTDQVLAEGKSRLAALNGDVAAKRITAEQIKQARAREEENIDAMNYKLAAGQTLHNQYLEASKKFVGTPQSRRDLDAEIARMRKQVLQLEETVADYRRSLKVSKA